MYKINTIDVCDNHNITEIIENGKLYHICNICGRKSFKKIKSHGKVWCNKHYKQFKKYGKAIDCNPRNPLDKNEIRVDGCIAYIDAYDINGNVIATGKFDSEDIPKIRYTKWKLSANGYLMNTPKFKASSKHFSREILGTNDFVDHINHDTLDNRKCNLRVVTKSQNQMNSNHRGISNTKTGKYYAHIKINQHMINLGTYVDEEEALYARWYAEILLFKEYRYNKPEPVILENRKIAIQDYVERKVQRL